MSRSDDWITARLHRLAAESALAGARLHAVGDQGVPFRRIAETIGHHLDVPARTISPAEAEAHFGIRSAWDCRCGPDRTSVPGSACYRFWG
jgi:hypothetical protein